MRTHLLEERDVEAEEARRDVAGLKGLLEAVPVGLLGLGGAINVGQGRVLLAVPNHVAVQGLAQEHRPNLHPTPTAQGSASEPHPQCKQL